MKTICEKYQQLLKLADDLDQSSGDLPPGDYTVDEFGASISEVAYDALTVASLIRVSIADAARHLPMEASLEVSPVSLSDLRRVRAYQEAMDAEQEQAKEALGHLTPEQLRQRLSEMTN